jgi:hypothetical protein
MSGSSSPPLSSQLEAQYQQALLNLGEITPPVYIQSLYHSPSLLSVLERSGIFLGDILGLDLLESDRVIRSPSESYPVPLLWTHNNGYYVYGAQQISNGASIHGLSLTRMFSEWNRDILTQMFLVHSYQQWLLSISRSLAISNRGAYRECLLALRHLPRNTRRRRVDSLARVKALLDSSYWWRHFAAAAELSSISRKILRDVRSL